jgi:hypothetical protein
MHPFSRLPAGLALSAALAALALSSPALADESPGPERDTSSHDEHDHHDRGLQPFWASARGGYEFLDLTTFVASEEEFSADLIPTQANGPTGQLALGVRLLGLSLGARGTVMSLTNVSRGSNMQGGTLWSVAGELGLHIAAGHQIDPFVMLGGGYTEITGMRVTSLDQDVRVRGYNARAGVGVDVYVSRNVALGVLGMGELLFLTRPGVSARGLLTPEQVETVGEAKARALEADGSTVGTALSITAGPSVHF